MTVRSIDGSETPSFTGHDQMSAYILGRIAIIETCLSLLALTSPSKETIKNGILKLVERMKTDALSSGQSEVEAACAEIGHRHSLDAIFPEVPAKK